MTERPKRHICQKSFGPAASDDHYTILCFVISSYLYVKFRSLSNLNNRCLFTFFKSLFTFERERVRAGEGQRERETQNPKQAPGSEL